MTTPPHSTPAVRIAYHSKDIALKVVSGVLGADVFARFRISIPPIVGPLPTELPALLIGTESVDLLFMLADDTILHTEFQTTSQPDDIFRFLRYHLEIHQRHRRRVRTIVFYGAGITQAPSTIRTSQCTFRLTNVFIGKHDGARVLRRLQRQRAAGLPLTREDQVDLIFLPLMRQTRPLDEVVPRAVRLARDLPVAERERTVAAMLGLAYSKMSVEVVAGVLKELGMQSVLERLIEARLLEVEAQFEEAKAQYEAEYQARFAREVNARVEEVAAVLVEGRVEGRVEGLREALRVILVQRFGPMPPVLQARITAAGADELDLLLAHAVTVPTIDAL